MINDLSPTTLKYIKDAAQNKAIQEWIVKAMFNGCQRGTDIFNHYDMVIPQDLVIKMFGSVGDVEDDPNADMNCIYLYPEAATLLIDAVLEEIIKNMN